MAGQNSFISNYGTGNAFLNAKAPAKPNTSATPPQNTGTDSAGKPIMSLLTPVGVKAKSPVQNMIPPTNTLTASQQAPVKPPTSTPQTTGNTYAPGTPQNSGAAMTTGTSDQAPPVDQSGVTPNGTVIGANGQTTSAPNAQGLYPSLINHLASTASSYQPLAQNAATSVAGIQSNIGQLREQLGSAQAGNLTGGLTLPVAQGRAQVLGQTEAAQEQGLGIQQQAQQGLFQNLIAAQTAQQSGLNQAATLAQPANTNFTYTPGTVTQNAVTGQTTNAPQLGPIGTQQYYTPGQSNSSPYGTGPEAAANVGSIQDQTTQVNNWSQARQSAGNIIQNNLNPILSKNGINPNDLNAINQFVQLIAGQTSNPVYKEFGNVMSELASSYASILTQPGQDPTNLQTTIAQGLLNPSAKGETFSQVLQGLDSQAYQKILGAQQNVDRLKTGQNVNPAPTQSTTGGGSSSSASGFGWNG